MQEPFMEHPTGEFDSAILAMEDAIKRLHSLSKWEQWITFCAQGEGSTPDNYQMAEIKMLGKDIDIGDHTLNINSIMKQLKVESLNLILDNGTYRFKTNSYHEMAVILDSIFRSHFGIKPFKDESNDYAVGVEWE